jgi:predicted CDP-diglyceride synthetase/phosphatidate cytidylyltransferase
MKIKQYSELLFYIPLTLLLIADFFPDAYLSNGIVMKVNIGLLIALFVMSIILKQSRNVDDVEKINGQIFALVYLLSWMALLTLLDGASQSGFGFDNVVVWFVVLISIAEIISKKKKMNH